MKMRNFMTMVSDFSKQQFSHVKIERYRKELSIALTVIFFVGIGGLVYRWYVEKREVAASYAFAQCMKSFEHAKSDVSKWPGVLEQFEAGYKEHKSSTLAPYFLAYEAEVYLNMGNREQALQTLRSVTIAKSSLLYGGYAVKTALLEIDIADAAVGLQSLQDLAKDTHNSARDMALYYLGLYHWSQNDVAQAKIAWQDLVQLDNSPYAAAAQDRLQYLV